MNDVQEKNIWLRDQCDELCGTEPSRVVSDIINYEQEHLSLVAKQYGRFLNQSELFYELIIQLSTAVNYIDKSNYSKIRGLQFFLIIHNLKSLYSSFDRLIKGFYEDSIILARPVYEAFIKAIYIACYPNEPWETITNQKNSLRKKFNLTNFLRDDLKLNWDDYKFLSVLSHANSFSILKEVVSIEKEGQKDIIALKFGYDQKMCEFGINWIGFLLLVYLKIIVCLFIPNDTDNPLVDKEALQKAKKLISLKEEAFLLHPKQHWPQTIQDLRDILLLMNEVERGNEWEKSWEKIRSSSNVRL